LINGKILTVPPILDGSVGYPYLPGSVVQVNTVRSDSRTTLSSSNSGNGNTISQLNLSITPQFSNSLLIMQWMINCELHHDNVFLIHKNGSLITASGEQGYNAETGNSRWSGFASSTYDQNENSTPENIWLQYFCVSGSKDLATFAPAVRSSSATNYTLALNRTLGSAGVDAFENMVSTGIIWEIAQ
jgi:hypothetical protein